MTLVVRDASCFRGQVPLPSTVRQDVFRGVARDFEENRFREAFLTINQDAPLELTASRFLPFSVETDLDSHALFVTERAQPSPVLKIESRKHHAPPESAVYENGPGADRLDTQPAREGSGTRMGPRLLEGRSGTAPQCPVKTGGRFSKNARRPSL